MGKNVAVFVDVANIFYAAKAAGVDIDYVTLLKAATAGPRSRARLRLHRARPGQREPAQLPRLPAPQQLQGRQQGHPQVRRRQGQGEPRHRARRRHDEDGPEPRHRDRRVGRRRLRAGHPRRPGAGRPGRGHQLPRQHQLRPDRGRRPVHRHRPAGARREGHALRPTRRRRRRGPVDDRGARQADRGDRRRSRPWSRPRPRSARPSRSRRRAATADARGRDAEPRRGRCGRATAPAWSRCRASGCRAPAGSADRGGPGAGRGVRPSTTSRTPATEPPRRGRRRRTGR